MGRPDSAKRWWDARFPPNGWSSRCHTRAVSEARLAKYKEEGVPVPPAVDGTGGGTLKIKTSAPPVKYTTYINERKGTVEQVPDGVDPAFNWNVGKAGQAASAIAALDAQIQNLADKKEQLVAQKADYEDAPDKNSLPDKRKRSQNDRRFYKRNWTASRLNPTPASGKTPADWEEKAGSIQAKKDYFAYKRGLPFGRGHGKIHAVSQRP